MMNCFCSAVSKQKTFSFIFSQDHCQRSHHFESPARRDQELNLCRP